MEFIGKAGWAAPRLKDAAISLDKLQEGYVEMIVAMRTLYQKCKLVHGDLSKYNILYYEGHLYIIDVSQAVDLDHPQALDFLCEDCVHVSEFFKKHGVAVMTIRELFDFIVDPTIADVAVDSYLEEVQQRILATGDMTPEDQITDSLFVQSYIPKMLEQVKNVEDDAFWMTSGKDTKDMYYQTVTGLKQALTLSQTAGAQKDQLNGFNEFKGTIEPDDHSSSDSGESESGTDEDGSSSEAEVPWASLDKKAARKENKKKVKEEERSQKEQNSKGCKEKKEEIGKSSQNQVSNPSDKGKVL